MEKIDLISSLEKISSNIPNRILKIEGYVSKQKCQEYLEIIIYRGFSSSTTHPIEIDLEKRVIEIDHKFNNFRLFKGPLIKESNNFIRESKDPLFFLEKNNWI